MICKAVRPRGLRTIRAEADTMLGMEPVHEGTTNYVHIIPFVTITQSFITLNPVVKGHFQFPNSTVTGHFLVL